MGAARPPKYSTPWLLWTPINFFVPILDQKLSHTNKILNCLNIARWFFCLHSRSKIVTHQQNFELPQYSKVFFFVPTLDQKLSHTNKILSCLNIARCFFCPHSRSKIVAYQKNFELPQYSKVFFLSPLSIKNCHVPTKFWGASINHYYEIAKEKREFLKKRVFKKALYPRLLRSLAPPLAVHCTCWLARNTLYKYCDKAQLDCHLVEIL